jgi:hypothetical protein
MPKTRSLFLMFLGLLSLFFFGTKSPSALFVADVASTHLQMRLPPDKETLGRDIIAELEHCYEFMNRATGSKLPRKIFLTIDWDLPDSSCNFRQANITIGMKQPAASNTRAFLAHSAAREISRMGLLALSQGAMRRDNEFLFEGMIEILVHEYDHSSRSLEAAWVLSQFLDEMQLLGLAPQRNWPEFSGGRRSLRSAAPGITFLMTFRELQSRERPIKFFEAVKLYSLTESLAIAFKAPGAELEDVWLKRVREYRAPDEITIAADEAPQLLKTVFSPEAGQPGSTLQMHLFLKDAADNLLPDGVFVKDERSGRLFQAQAAPEKNALYVVVAMPLEGNCLPGTYNYQVTAADETGNLRRWKGSYKVAAP